MLLQQLESNGDSNYDTAQIGSFFKTIAMWGVVLPGKIDLLDRPRQDLSYQLFFALQIKSNVSLGLLFLNFTSMVSPFGGISGKTSYFLFCFLLEQQLAKS